MAIDEADAARRSGIIRTRYTTADPLEVREFLDTAYNAKVTVEGSHVDERPVVLRTLEAGPITLTELDLPVDLRYELVGAGECVFTTLLSGTAEYERPNGLERFTGGDVHVGIDPHAAHPARSRAIHATTIALSARLLDEVAESQGLTAGRGWTFTAARAATGDARRWRRAAGFVEEMLTPADATAGALLTGPASRLLAATALTVFPNTALGAAPEAPRRDGRPATLRRAIAFIEANPDLDLTIADVANAAAVTPRAVQLAFRRHLDTTPLAYLRRVRLGHAREQLRRAVPGDGLAVTAVAVEWGFANPSHFARRYRDVFGESPSDTLAR